MTALTIAGVLLLSDPPKSPDVGDHQVAICRIPPCFRAIDRVADCGIVMSIVELLAAMRGPQLNLRLGLLQTIDAAENRAVNEV